jgi:TusA-related sulfurtransferase
MYCFDLRSSLIPFSLLRITNTYRQMKPGEEIEILSGSSAVDKETLTDIKRILTSENYDSVEDELLEGDDVVIVTRLRKQSTHTNNK